MFFFFLPSPSLAFWALSGLVLTSVGQNWQKSSCILQTALCYACLCCIPLCKRVQSVNCAVSRAGVRAASSGIVSHSFLCLWAQLQVPGISTTVSGISITVSFPVFQLPFNVILQNAVCASNSTCFSPRCRFGRLFSSALPRQPVSLVTGQSALPAESPRGSRVSSASFPSALRRSNSWNLGPVF